MEHYEKKAALLKALAHPARLLIMDMLRRERMCICQLTAVLGKPQPYVSQQIRVLREAGLVACHKSGTYKCYHIKDPEVEKLLDVLLGESPSAVFFLKKGKEAMRTCVGVEDWESLLSREKA